MNRHLIWLLPLLAVICSGCPLRDDDMRPVTEYEPLFMSRAQLETSVAYVGVQPIKQAGKIFVMGNRLYLNEKYKGIHVFDNTNPASPQKTGFIRIPGCIDMSFKGDVLYADNATDLVAVDISTLPQAQVLNRQRNAFPELSPPDLGYLPDTYLPENRLAGLVIVGWTKKKS
jgi:hypothetical protein